MSGDDPLLTIARFATDLVVQAGAGTGKTHALVTLYLHLVAGLTEARRPLAPAEIAVVTFTDKAAGELKTRIRERLLRLAVSSSGQLAALEPTLPALAAALGRPLPAAMVWQEALAALGAAPIGTFHGLFGALLRRHAARVGVDPEYTLLDDSEGQGLLTEIAERTILGALTADDRGVARLVGEYRFRGHAFADGLVEQVVRLCGMRAEEATPRPLDERYRPAAIAAAWSAAAADFELAAAALSALGPRLAPKSADKVRRFAAALAGTSLTELDAVDTAVELLQRIHSAKEEVGRVRAARERLFEADAARLAAPLAEALARLVADVEAGYREEKRRGGLVDFSDLLTLSRDLLRGDAAVLAAVRARFAALLVDELQDTNPVQAELVEHLGRRDPGQPARLFIVGDRKQSIYQFRGAEVALFTRAAVELCERGGAEVLLRQSRRSVPSVLALCNALFGRALAAGDDAPWEVGYRPERDDLLPLRAAPASEHGAELIAVTPQKGKLAETRAREAKAIARRLAALRREGRALGKVAILLRRFTHLTDYLDALKEAGLPYLVVRGRGLYASDEARDLAAALMVLDDPDDRLALATALRSPLVGLSDAELLRLALDRRLDARPLFDLEAPALALSPLATASLRRFAETMLRLRAAADRLGPVACLEGLIGGTDLIPVVAGMDDGAERVGNLAELVEEARRFEGRGGSLRAFVHQLAEKSRVGAEPTATSTPPLDEEGDLVRVMTVHQSKGLEFEVVFVPACGGQDPVDRAAVVYDRELGLGLKVRRERPRGAGRWQQTPAWRQIAERNEGRRRAESLRTFYVATTRARDLVIFSGESTGRDGAWRRYLDEVQGAPATAALLRAIDGATLPAPPSATPPAAATEEEERLVEEELLRLSRRPRVAAARLTVAVTELAEFRDCARRYQLLFLFGLEEPPLPHRPSPRPREPESTPRGDEPDRLPLGLDATALGTLAHRLLEKMPFSRHGADAVELDRLLDGEGLDRQEPEVAELRARLVTFLGTSFARALDGVPLRRELPFLLALPSEGGLFYLRGQMDLVVLRREGVGVIDYKYARPGDPEDYRFQLAAYAAAAGRLYAKAPAIETGLAFLRGGEPAPRFRPALPLAAIEAELVQLLRRLADARANDEWPLAPLATCERLGCGFVRLCHPEAR